MQMIRILFLWLFALSAYAADIELTWTDPGVSVDGFIIGHNINGARQSDIIISNSDIRSHTVAEAAKGIHFFNIKSFVGSVNSTETPSNGVLLTDELTLTIEVK